MSEWKKWCDADFKDDEKPVIDILIETMQKMANTMESMQSRINDLEVDLQNLCASTAQARLNNMKF
tara:strand:- start:1121 stop:1318 length:198 start_codon:yes stop_codon:yes gene_type:complete